MEKKINPVLKRLSDFADSQGGFAEIGRRIHKHPSMFYNLIRRDALPSVATLTEIAMEFPELDLNFIIRGEGKPEGAAAAELDKLKSALQREQAITTALLGKSRGVTISPGERNEDVRRKQFSDTMKSLRGKRSTSKPASVHVQGAKIPTLADLFN